MSNEAFIPMGVSQRVSNMLADNEVDCPNCSHQFAGPPQVVHRVITASDHVRQGGEPIGTKRLGPNGEIAVRVDDPTRGPMWRLINPDGSVSEDMRNELSDWTLLTPVVTVE
jgi:hypothetical protein